jgi:alkenylglycerophosphocholine/alkenylglycerophosphoethanolamine hydrolase
MYLWLILAFIFAFLEAIAVSKNILKLEYFAKPAVMICLFLWLYTGTGLQGSAFWFGLGILLSLAGDILLMISLERLFLFGLVAFLLAHIFYITGFREELGNLTAWSLILAIFIAINIGRLLRRIVGVMQAKGEDKLIVPVIIYGTVISVMLYAAMSTVYDPAWKTSAAFLVSAGAILFCASDAILAWNKFVSPVKNGRVWNMALYHLGQIGLVAGAISQFA